MKWDDKTLDAKFEEMEGNRSADTKRIMDSLEELKPKDRAKDEDKEEEKKKKEEEKAKDREIEGELEEEAPEGTGDKARDARDSAFLVDSYRETVAAAEIIAPGIQIRVADADLSAKPRKTLDAICDLRRRALDMGLQNEDTAEVITQVRGRALDSARLKRLTCNDVRYLFRSVSALKGSQNSSVVRDSIYAPVAANRGGYIDYAPTSSSDSVDAINKRNADFYAAK